jgi:hypothetical protein
MTGKIYFAGPWFNPRQVERYEAVLSVLTEWRDDLPTERGLYVPREVPCPPDADVVRRRRVYDRNLAELEDSTAVVAITDEKDIGTIFELGYAAKIRDGRVTGGSILTGPKLIGIAFDLGGNPFNLMLAQGLDAVCLSLDELRAVVFHGVAVSYDGTIE